MEYPRKVNGEGGTASALIEKMKAATEELVLGVKKVATPTWEVIHAGPGTIPNAAQNRNRHSSHMIEDATPLDACFSAL